MNKQAIFFALILIIFGSSAIAQDTTWYTSSWRETTSDKAHYYRTRIKTNVGWQVTDHFLSGAVQMTGTYMDDSFHIRNGECIWYNEKGFPKHRCHYVQNKLEGADTLYYPDGGINVTGNYKEGKKQGKWCGYYPSGKISGKAIYDKDKEISVSFYHENGSADKSIAIFMRDSDYPGGVPQYLRFLNKTFRYPDSAVVHQIEGTVLVGFTISKEGKPYDFKIVQSVDKLLDEEALRVLKKMPDWEPAITGGIVCESQHTQPIVFALK